MNRQGREPSKRRVRTLWQSVEIGCRKTPVRDHPRGANSHCQNGADTCTQGLQLLACTSIEQERRHASP